MEDCRVTMFLEEWKEGWKHKDPMIQEANRLSMRQQLLALLANGVLRPAPFKPGERGK